jgi:hypothetical protein
VTVVVPTGRPVAVSELFDKEPGDGLHVITGLTDAEPAVVSDAAESVLVHPVCVADATAIGAGVIVTVITLLMGAQEPGGFMVS